MYAERETSLPFRRRALLAALIAFVLVLVVWNVPQLSGVLYPFRLFVTFVHESGHGLAAIISGGTFGRFEVFSNGSGVALTAGGSRALILPAGYLCAAFFGAILFYLANRVPHTRVISFVLGAGLILITLLYTDFLATAFIVGVLMGAALILLGWRAHQDINLIILNVLAMLTGLNAVLDLFYLVNNSGAGLGTVRNDAVAFSAQIAPIIPAWVWAGLWALIALAALGASVWYSVIHPFRRRNK